MGEAELSRVMKLLAELETGNQQPSKTKHLNLDAKIRPTDLKGKQPSLRKRAGRGLARVLIIFSTGVASTLAWQSYGDTLRARIASSYPQLGWLAPQTAAQVETLPAMVVTPTTAATPSPDYSEQLKTGLAAMRESVNQIVATQQWMAGDIAKLQAGQQDILANSAQRLHRPQPMPRRANPLRRRAFVDCQGGQAARHDASSIGTGLFLPAGARIVPEISPLASSPSAPSPFKRRGRQHPGLRARHAEPGNSVLYEQPCTPLVEEGAHAAA